MSLVDKINSGLNKVVLVGSLALIPLAGSYANTTNDNRLYDEKTQVIQENRCETRGDTTKFQYKEQERKKYQVEGDSSKFQYKEQEKKEYNQRTDPNTSVRTGERLENRLQQKSSGDTNTVRERNTFREREKDQLKQKFEYQEQEKKRYQIEGDSSKFNYKERKENRYNPKIKSFCEPAGVPTQKNPKDVKRGRK